MAELTNTNVKKYQPQGKLKKVTGTALRPESSNVSYVLNIASISGNWDSPFQLLLSKKWPAVKPEFRKWFGGVTGFKLGELQEVFLQSDVTLLNLLVLDKAGNLDEKAMVAVMKKTVKLCKDNQGTVHIDDHVLQYLSEDLLKKYLVDEGLHVFIYS